MFWIYNILLTLLAPLWVPWMLWRASRRKEPVNWKERTGDFSINPRKDGRRIWIHAVSVGEVVAALPILERVKELLPDFELVLSVTTGSGYAVAKERASEFADHIVFFPIDVVRFQVAALSRVRPSVVAIMETELWLNFLWAAKSFGAETMLINGRLSDRSFRRSLKVKFFYSALVRHLDHSLVQTKIDAERIETFGARDVRVLGNSKFDQAHEVGGKSKAEWIQELGLDSNLPIIVIGSTRSAQEEDIVVEAIRAIDAQSVQVIHAPRHLERVPELAELVRQKCFSVGLRSKGEHARYVILDTYGELASLYAVADIVVIGGGFEPHGGQNILQPLAHGKPVIHGEHMFNFRDVAEAALAAGATRSVPPEKLAATLMELLKNPGLRETMGQNAKRFIDGSLGASERYAAEICEAAKRVQPSFERSAKS